MDAIAILKEYGPWVAVAAALGYFWQREAWPFIKQRVEVAHADRIAQQKEFFDTLSKFAELVTTQRQATLTALDQLTRRMDETARTLSGAVALIEQLHATHQEQPRRPRTH